MAIVGTKSLPTHEFDQFDEATVRKGQVIATCLIAANLGLLLLSLSLTKLATPNHEMVTDIAKFIVVMLLFLGLYNGLFWARAILIVLYSLSAFGAVFLFIASVKSFEPILWILSLVWVVAAATVALVLMHSTDLCVFMESRRQGWSPPVAEPDEPIFLGGEPADGKRGEIECEACPWCDAPVVQTEDETCRSCGRPV